MPDIKLIELDFAVLATLPEEGTSLGFTVLAKQSKAIITDLNEQLPAGAPKVTSASINGRLRALKLGGYVVDVTVQPVASGQGWQVTPKGKRLLAERDAHRNPVTITDLDRQGEAPTPERTV